jgi:hypothetical protein
MILQKDVNAEMLALFSLAKEGNKKASLLLRKKYSLFVWTKQRIKALNYWIDLRAKGWEEERAMADAIRMDQSDPSYLEVKDFRGSRQLKLLWYEDLGEGFFYMMGENSEDYTEPWICELVPGQGFIPLIQCRSIPMEAYLLWAKAFNEKMKEKKEGGDLDEGNS